MENKALLHHMLVLCRSGSKERQPESKTKGYSVHPVREED